MRDCEDRRSLAITPQKAAASLRCKRPANRLTLRVRAASFP